MSLLRIAFIGDNTKDYPEFRDRYIGFKRSHKQHNVPLRPELLFRAGFSEEAGYRATQTLLNSGCDFSAIFCCSDLLAIGTIKALREQQLRVPKDKAVVGYDDIPTAEHLSPALTTVQ